MEDQLEILKADLAVLERDILDQFTIEGVRSMRAADGSTVYLQKETFARARNGNDAAVVAVLESLGLTHFIRKTFSSRDLALHMRSYVLGNRVSPFDAVLEPIDRFVVRVRLGTKGGENG